LNHTPYFQNRESLSNSYQHYFTGFSWLDTRPNIILLFAESLSTVDSKRAWGIYDNLPLFDAIQSQGITFTNFIANWCTSETAHIAVLKGVEPWEYPLIDTNTTYDSYAAYGEPLPVFMQKHWYTTAFVSSVTLDFLNQRAFISWLQFQHIIGEESFTNQKKYVFDAAPDHVLYKRVVDLASSYSTTDSPYFLAVQNVSAHRPYDTPYGKTSQQMFSYVDESLDQFYQDLEDSWFFTNGILLIVSDHRKMEPITKEEFETFWLSAKSRVVATAVWAWITSWVINNTILQHTDLYHSLKYLVASGGVELSLLFNDVFSSLANRDWGIRYCRYADKVYFRINQNGSSWMITDKQEDTPLKQYIQAYKWFQAETLLGLSWIVDYETPKSLSSGTSLILIARWSGPYEKWSLNTLDSAVRAQKDWADWLYLDVVFTQDGHGVVLHWASLNDTQCWTGKNVGDFTLSDLQEQCRFKNWSQIFTLKEFLLRTKDLFTLFFVDIHYVFDSSIQEVEALIHDIIKSWLQDKIVLISSDKQLDSFLLSHDTLLVWNNQLSSVTSWSSLWFKHDFYLFSGNVIDQSSVELIKALNKNIVLSLSDDYDSLDTALSFGIPYIITDNLSLVKKMLSPQLK
jgi:glycerophosphoryl diester phosphodiesterase